jgi:hypothetical protein
LRKRKVFDPSVKDSWAIAWKHRSFRVQFIITLLVVLSFSVVFNRFFDFVESRHGSSLIDFVLDYLPVYDVSWLVFFFLYSGILVGIYYHLNHPKTILIVLQTYVLVTLTRICTITLIPLEPPQDYLPLREPFVQLFTTDGKIISKDLFFSGHMSTILSLYFASHRKYVREFLMFCSMMIGVLVLIQRVHYTIDVIVAIPATFVMYYFSKNNLGGKSF